MNLAANLPRANRAGFASAARYGRRGGEQRRAPRLKSVAHALAEVVLLLVTRREGWSGSEAPRVCLDRRWPRLCTQTTEPLTPVSTH